MSKRLLLTIAGLLLLASAAIARDSLPRDAKDSDFIRLQVLENQVVNVTQRALENQRLILDSASTRSSQPGVRLLKASVREDESKHELRITMDFSAELLTYGLGVGIESVLGRILTEVGNLPGLSKAATSNSDTNYVEFQILIEGVPLNEYAAEKSKKKSAEISGTSVEELSSAEVGASLSGRRLAISPGHGWYLNETQGWILQRPSFFGIVEDFVNAEITMDLNSELTSTGADIRPTREMNKNAGPGTSQQPKWQEAAKYYIQSLGAPSSVYSNGSNELDRDIDSRPLYANWINADILVSVHNNADTPGSLGTGSGTETWYDTTNGFQVESKRLATAIHNSVVSAISQGYNSNWIDRGVKASNGHYGENRWATRPAALVEIAFMSTQHPDNDSLHDERFKQLVAHAIRVGIDQYFAPSGTGRVNVGATLNGAPWSGPVSYSVSGATNFVGSQTDMCPGLPSGGYTVLYLSGGPSGASLTGLVPPASQLLPSGGVIGWTFHFTSDGGPFCSAGIRGTAEKDSATACGGSLSVSLTGTGTGRVLSNPAGIDCPSTCTMSFATGTQVLLSPIPSAGSTFAGWSGDAACSSGSVTMNTNRSCTATFTATSAAYNLTVSTSGSGSVTSSDGGINCGGACSHTYLAGSTVTLAASAASGWSFSSWSGNCTGGTVVQVTMTSNQSCTANFVQTPATTPVTTTGSATNVTATSATLNGTINPENFAATAYFEYGPDPNLGNATPGISFGPGNNSFFPYAQTVTGLACATNYRFRAVGVGAGGEYIASNNTFMTAQCPPATCYLLNLIANGDAPAPVPSPANASGCPNGQFHAGDHIALTVVLVPGDVVTGWGGTDNDTSTATTNTVTMNFPYNRAVYVIEQHICYHLTLGFTGQGSAPVATNPVGYCPADYFPWGYEVRVNASPATGWRVGGWNGTLNDTRTDTVNFIVMPTGNQTALVQYVPLMSSLQVFKGGNGAGTIVSDLPGINCGPTCSALYPFGTTVTLSAFPDAGSSFTSWSGSCPGGVVNFPPGAICYPTFQLQLIFSDGFESGDLSAWQVYP